MNQEQIIQYQRMFPYYGRVPRLKTLKDLVFQIMLPHENNYPFHNYDHVLNPWYGAWPVAHAIGTFEGLIGERLEQVEGAMISHDVGYHLGSEGHELRSAEMAEYLAKRAGYDNTFIAGMIPIILATDISEEVDDVLEHKIARDSDTAAMGLDVGLHRGQLLRKELGIDDIDEWNRLDLIFYKAHEYYTDTAKAVYGPGKAENMQKLQELVGDFHVDLQPNH